MPTEWLKSTFQNWNKGIHTWADFSPWCVFAVKGSDAIWKLCLLPKFMGNHFPAIAHECPVCEAVLPSMWGTYLSLTWLRYDNITQLLPNCLASFVCYFWHCGYSHREVVVQGCKIFSGCKKAGPKNMIMKKIDLYNKNREKNTYIFWNKLLFEFFYT